jgi:hypothetical protein
MPNSLIKYATDKGEYHWGRADIDGMPFKGDPTLQVTEDEADERFVMSCEPKNRVFDLSDANDNAEYLNVIDKTVNGWFKIIHQDRVIFKDEENKKVIIKVYLEWVVPAMIDGKPVGVR